MSGEVVSEVGGAEEETLDLVIETQLANGHQNLKIIIEEKLLIKHFATHRSACGPVHSIEQFFEAFILSYPYQSINGVFVAATKSINCVAFHTSDSLAPLVRGQLDVILHPDVDHVPRGAHDAPAAPRHRGHG